MFRLRRTRPAQIDSSLRAEFEIIGRPSISLLLRRRGIDDRDQNGRLALLLKDHREELIVWMREQRQVESQYSARVDLLFWAMIIFVMLEVIIGIWPALSGLLEGLS